MGIWSDLEASLDDDIDNTAGYGIREKKKKRSSKRISSSMMGQTQTPVTSLEPHEFTSIEHGDMSVEPEPEEEMSLDRPMTLDEQIREAIDSGDFGDAKTVEEIAATPAPISAPDVATTGMEWGQLDKKLAGFFKNINPTNEILRQERAKWAVDDRDAYYKGEHRTQKALDATADEAKHLWNAVVDGSWSEGAAYIGTKMLKGKTPAAIAATIAVNTIRHAWTEKDEENPDAETVSWLVRQAATLGSPETYKEMTGDDWYTYKRIYNEIEEGKLTPAQAEKIKQKQSFVVKAAYNEFQNFTKTMTHLGGELLEGVADMAAGSMTAFQASQEEYPDIKEKLADEAEALFLSGLERAVSVPLHLVVGAGTVVGSTIANPLETAQQMPLGAALVGAVQAPRAIEMKKAQARVYKDVAATHGRWEGAKAAYNLSPEMVRAIRNEIVVDESAVGKFHNKMVNLFGDVLGNESFVQGFLDVFHRVEKTAPGAEMIYRRGPQETAALWQKFQDNFGKELNNIPRENIVLLEEMMGAGQTAAHWTAYWMSEVNKATRSGGDVFATKLLQSKKGKVKDAEAAEASLQRTVKEGDIELKAEHLEELNKLKDEFKALALEDAVREGDASQVTQHLRDTGEKTIMDGKIYEMPLGHDRFIHYTTKANAEKIIQDQKLLFDPPTRTGLGIDAVVAVSSVWGSLVPGTQNSRIAPEDMVAISFQTKTKPDYGYGEEVVWHEDVDLTNAKVISAEEANRLLQKTAEEIREEDAVRYSEEDIAHPEYPLAAAEGELAATASEWVDPGGERRVFLEDIDKQRKVAEEETKRLTNELSEGRRKFSSAWNDLRNEPVMKADPALFDRVLRLAQDRPYDNPQRFHTKYETDPITGEELPVSANYANRPLTGKVGFRPIDLLDAQEAAYGVPRRLDSQFDVEKPTDYQGLPEQISRDRQERADYRSDNLTQWLDAVQQDLPLIWSYKGREMDLTHSLLDSTLSGDIQARQFNPENIDVAMNPEWAMENPQDAYTVKKMLPLILGLRRDTARHAANMTDVLVNPTGQTAMTQETTLSNFFSFTPALKDRRSKIKIEKDESGVKKFGGTFTPEELEQHAMAEMYTESQDPTVGLDVGRAASSLPKSFARHLTPEERKTAGFLAAEQFITAVLKSKRRGDEVHAQYRQNHEYRRNYERTLSLIENKDMVLLNQLWTHIPKDGGKLTKAALGRVNNQAAIEALAEKLTNIAQKENSPLKHYTEVEPDDVWKVLGILWDDAHVNGAFKNRYPNEAYQQIPDTNVPGMKGWKTHGAVAGAWVPPAQYQHLTHWKTHPIEKLTRGRTAGGLREINNAWKGTHTIAVPGFYFNLIMGTLELNLKDGAMPLGPKSTSAYIVKALRGTLKNDETYVAIRDRGYLPEVAFGLEYSSKANTKMVNDAVRTLMTRMDKGDSFPIALKKAMIQLGKDAVMYEVPEGQKVKFLSNLKEMQAEFKLTQRTSNTRAGEFILAEALGLLKESVVVAGEALTGFGALGAFATRLDHAFKTASMERRVDAHARLEKKSSGISYEAARKKIFENEELIDRLARDAADANINYLHLPRVSKWLGPTGMAPFFNYMAAATKKMMAHPSQYPWAFQMYSEGMRMYKETLFGEADPDDGDEREETQRAVHTLMQLVPTETWMKIPGIISGERTVGHLGRSPYGREDSGKILRVTYTQPFQADMFRYVLGMEGEHLPKNLLKGGVVTPQPMAGFVAALYHAAQSKGPYGEDLAGFDFADSARKKVSYVAKNMMPTYVHWLGDASERAKANPIKNVSTGEITYLDPKSNMTLEDIQATAAGIPIRGALWLAAKRKKLESAVNKLHTEIDNSLISDEEKEKHKNIVEENYYRMLTPWLRGSW